MRLELRMIIVLTLIAATSGLVLSYTYKSTQEDIKRNAELAKKKALVAVIPGTKDYEEKMIDKETTLLIAKDENGNIIGYAALTEGAGFQGKIKLMVGFDKTLTRITGLEILEHVETPGLGNRIEEDWFKEQFKGRTPPITYVKGRKPEKENEIQAITGATISSKSVVRIINVAHEKLKSFLNVNSEPQASAQESRATQGIDRQTLINSVKEILPETKSVTEEETFFVLKDKDENIIAYAKIGEGEGYNGPIKVLAIFDPQVKSLLGIKILSHHETEGIGTKIENPEFLAQFRGKEVPLNESKIDVITGATISSKSLIEIVNNIYEELKKEIEK